MTHINNEFYNPVEEDEHGTPVFLNTRQFSRWEDYCFENSADFYRNKVCYHVEKAGRKFKIFFLTCPFEHYEALVKISKDKEAK